MQRILLMTDFYYPKPSANGVCAHEVALELKKLGFEVHILCFKRNSESDEEKFEGLYIHRIKSRFFFKMREYREQNKKSLLANCVYKLSLLIYRLKKVIFLPFYPLTSVSSVYRYYKKSKKLVNEHDISNIIAQYSPLEAVIAGIFLKKQKLIRYFMLYVVDSFTTTYRAQKHKNIEKAGWNWEKKLYTAADFVINMKFEEKYQMKRRYDKYREKITYLDIPLVLKHDDTFEMSKKDIRLPSDKINFVYAGGLSKSSRNPIFLCNIFMNVKRNSNYKINFFSKGDCDDILHNYEKKTDGLIRSNNSVPKKEIINILEEADILLSIGNQGTKMVPSKTFEYMSMGKPIIHFYKDDDDSVLQYLKKYPLALCIKEKPENLNNYAKEVENFVVENYNKRLSFNLVESIFEQNTPKYTAKVMRELLIK